MKSAPNARARFSCGKENNCLSEGLYTKERFCYDKENQQLQTKMSTENPGQTVVECGKAAGYIKMVGKMCIRDRYDPDPKGIRDILIVDEKVFSVAEHIDPPELSAPVEVVSADGKMVIPGYVDQHVHVIGGGGAKLLVTRLSSLHEEVRDAVKAGVPVEKAIRICGENPARANGLFPKKEMCIRDSNVAVYPYAQ